MKDDIEYIFVDMDVFWLILDSDEYENHYKSREMLDVTRGIYYNPPMLLDRNNIINLMDFMFLR